MPNLHDLFSHFIFEPLFIAILLLILLGISIGLFIHSYMEKFKTNDEFPEIYYSRPQEISFIASTIVRVKVGFSATNILKFDSTNNIFNLDCIVWFQFDPTLLMVSLIGQFRFEKGKIVDKLPPTTKLIDEDLLIEYPVRIEFSSNFNFVNFPLDDHRIFIVVDNIATSAKDLTFTSSESFISWTPDMQIFGWKLIDYYVYTGYTKTQLDPKLSRTIITHPRTIFAVDLLQTGIRSHGIIFIPIFVAYALSFIAIGLDPYKHTTLMISLSAGSITGLLAFRFVLENLSPKVGYYTLADRFFLIFLLMVLIQTIIALYLITVPEIYRQRVPRLQIFTLIILFVIVLILVYRFLYKKVHR